MEEIEEGLARLEGYLDALRGEVARLRQQVRQKAKAEVEPEEDSMPAGSVQPAGFEGGESPDNLEGLYAQGFHVCNVHFGDRRWGQNCLFCNDLLRRGQGGNT